MGDQDRTILTRFIIGLVAVIVIAAIVWAIFFRHTTKKNVNEQTSKTTTAQQAPISDTNNDKSTKATQSTPNNAGEPKKLAETGPGHTIALFIATTAIASVAHHLYRKKAYLHV